MYRLRFRIWDTETKKWFKPEYAKAGIGKLPDLKEILITQNGDIMFRQRVNEVEFLIDDAKTKRFIKNGRIGIRDKNGEKYYFNDIVKYYNANDKITYGLLVWTGDGFGFSKIDKETKELFDADITCESELRNCEIAGNLYENPELIQEK